MTKIIRNNFIFKYRWPILALAVILCLGALFCLYVFSQDSSTVEILVSVDFPGAGSGLNPDGTKFDIHDMLDGERVKKVTNRLVLDIDAQGILERIQINPSFPDGIVEKIAQARKSGSSYVFYPTEFYLVFDVSKNDKVDKKTAERILSTLVEVYQEEFYALYADQGILENVKSSLEFENFDYPDITKVVRSHLNVISAYLRDKELGAGDFRSESTGRTFADLIQSLDVIRDVDLEKIDSIIYAYSLTRDKEKLILGYENKIKELKLEMEKKLGEADKAREMMEAFARDENIVYLPGLFGQGTEGIDRQSYYDVLAERAASAKVEAENLSHDIEYYNKEIEKLKNEDFSEGDKEQKEVYLNLVLEGLKDKLTQQLDLIYKTVDDYNKIKMGNAFKILEQKKAESK